MALNKANGNMYSWVTHTWNTVKGECPHGCTYCYMKRWGKQKPVRFDELELKTDLNGDHFLGTNSRNFIFVGSSCDLFADDIPYEWIKKTLTHCVKHYRNGYLFQSKNPARMLSFAQYFPGHTALCTTIESNRFYPEIMASSPRPSERAGYMSKLYDRFNIFITIEPILNFDLDEMVTLIKICNPKQVNIGADSGNNHLPEPSKEKLLALIDELQKFTIIDKKTNLSRLLK